MDTLTFPKKPCAECPWRTDVSTGRFPPGRYEALASTVYDMARKIFACHKSAEGQETLCAGFLLQGSLHNFTVRRALSTGEIDLEGLTDGGYPLFPTYRSMAIANGVKRRAPELRECRDDAVWRR